MMACMIICLPIVLAITTQSSQDVSRLNYGAMFQYVQDIQVTSYTWHHVFVVEIPKAPELFPSEHANQIANTHLHSDNHATFCSHRTPEQILTDRNLSMQCREYTAVLSLFSRTYMQNDQLLTHMYQMIQDLLPPQVTVPQDRSKRGFLNFIGELGRSLFGVATERQTDTLAQSMKSITAVVEGQNHALQKTISDFASMSLHMNERMNSIVEMIKDSAAQSMQTFNSKIVTAVERIDYLQTMSRRTINVLHITSLLTHQYDQFLLGLQTLAQGRLPSSFLPANALTSVIMEIQANVQGQRRGRRTPYISIFKTPLDVYSKAHFIYSCTDDHLYISVEFPLTSQPIPFKVYKLKTFDHIIDGNNSAVLRLTNLPFAVAMSMQEREWYAINEIEFSELTHTSRQFTNRRVFNSFLQPIAHCVVALYLDISDRIKAVCDYEIVVGEIKPQIYQLTDITFYLVGVTNYTLACQRTLQQHTECGSQCLLTMPDGCQLLTVDQNIRTHTSDDPGRNVSHSFLVSKVFLSYFYDESDLALISGQKIFDEPPVVDLPPIKVFKAPNEHLLAADNKYRLDLSRSIQALKDDKDIVATLSHSIVLGDINSEPGFGVWLSYVSIATSVMTVLLVIISFYLWLKLRNAAVALITLQNTLTRVTNATPNMTRWYRTFATETFSSTTRIQARPMLRLITTPTTTVITAPYTDVHTMIVSHLNDKWVYLAMAAIIATVFFLCIRHIIKKYVAKFMNVVARTSLVLRVYSQIGSIFVVVHTMYAPATEITVNWQAEPTNIAIHIGLKSYITYDWRASLVDQTEPSDVVVIEQTVRVSFVQALMLTYIVRRPYRMIPYLVTKQGNQIRYSKLYQIDEVEGVEV